MNKETACANACGKQDGSLCRQQVYDMVAAKMDNYFDRLNEFQFSDEPIGSRHSISQWLLDIGEQFDLVKGYTTTGGYLEGGLEHMLDLIAMCCLCMETHGCIDRPLCKDEDSCCRSYTDSDRHIPMTKSEIWFTINTERTYQNQKWQHDEPNARPIGVAGYVLTFKHYLDEAERGWVKSTGDEEALNSIRKLAAICVACLEHNGAPLRV